MYPIIVSPHKFGIKDEKDRIFVPLMLDSLRKTNPNIDIYFPNPNSFSLNIKGIKDISFINNEIDGLNELREKYVHFSTNPAEFEIACIERFFILRHVVKKLGIEKFFTIETDCLIFSSFNEDFERNKLKNHATYLTDNTCISTGFLTLDFLENYCNSVLNTYNSNKVVDCMRGWYAEYIAGNNLGGICDMTFCSAMSTGWLDFDKYEIYNFCEVQEINGKFTAYDNFCIRDKFLNIDKKIIMDKSIYDGYSIKKYFHDEKGYFVKFEEDERCVYLNTIHAQGNAKKIMGLLYVNHF